MYDRPSRKLKLADGATVPLRHKAQVAHDVRLVTTINVPPRSEMEVRGRCCTPPSSGLRLLEGRALGPYRCIIAARAILEASSCIPIRLLNTSDQTITMHEGTRVGELHEVEELGIGAVSSGIPTEPGIPISAEKHAILQALAGSTVTTSSEDKESFFSSPAAFC